LYSFSTIVSFYVVIRVEMLCVCVFFSFPNKPRLHQGVILIDASPWRWLPVHLSFTS